MPTLQVLTGFFLICGLSGPSIRLAAPIETEGIALGLVLDISGSMATEDLAWAGQPVSRLDAVRNVFHLLVAGGKSPEGLVFPGRPSDRIALVTFAFRPETACPLTSDHAALLSILDRQKAKTLISEATTNPGDALAWTLELLRKSPVRNKAIVFVTDGESNVGPPALTPLQAGQLAAALGVPIHTVDALSDADASSEAESAHRSLAELAKLTGGQYLKAGDGGGLDKAMHELDRLERDRLATLASRHVAYDLTYWFALRRPSCSAPCEPSPSRDGGGVRCHEGDAPFPERLVREPDPARRGPLHRRGAHPSPAAKCPISLCPPAAMARRRSHGA